MLWDVEVLEVEARRLFEEQWQTLVESSDSSLDSSCCCPAAWLLHDLLALVADNHHRPVHELTATIRQMIVEHNFIDGTGDNVVDHDCQQRIDQQVQTIVGVLESIRQQAVRDGRWCNTPTPELMFG